MEINSCEPLSSTANLTRPEGLPHFLYPLEFLRRELNSDVNFAAHGILSFCIQLQGTHACRLFESE